jgi:hypothetical protein
VIDRLGLETVVVDEQRHQELVRRLAGRTKRDLIRGMLVRSPHVQATEKLVLALEEYPLVYLLMAAEFPTKIWVLDRGELVSSAEILTPEMRRRRWHSTAISVDDCEGLTDVAPDYVAMVTSWKSLLVMRHEFAHVVTTFFSPFERDHLAQLYHRAGSRNHFMEPLARESIGEYLACSLTYTFFPDLSDELASFDPSLHRFVTRLRSRAEDYSQLLVAASEDA